MILCEISIFLTYGLMAPGGASAIIQGTSELSSNFGKRKVMKLPHS